MYKLSINQAKGVTEKASQELARYCIKHNIHYVVTGVSGGLDSAVVIGIAQKACEFAARFKFNLHSVGITMPCDSTEKSEILGNQAIEKFGTEAMRINLSETFHNNDGLVAGVNNAIADMLVRLGDDTCLEGQCESQKVAQGNIKARMRMMYGTYHVARMLGGMVLSTDNLSEFWMAYWTLHGDVGDYGPIQQVMKGIELYDIAQYLGVPQGIIDARPDDGLGGGGTDEKQLGANYPTIDRIMVTLIQKGFDIDGEIGQLATLPEVPGVKKEVVYKIARRCLVGSYKRKIGSSIILTREQLGLPALTDIVL